jgi:hypothetical protein
LSDAQAVLGQTAPQTMAPLPDGYRDHVAPSTDGGVEQRWVLINSAHRYPHAQHTVDTQLLKQGDEEVKAFKKLCRSPLACEADAQQALATFAQGLQATFLHPEALRPTPRDDKRG